MVFGAMPVNNDAMKIQPVFYQRAFRVMCAVQCTVLLMACAHSPQPLAPTIRQQLGKVYLASSGSPTQTFINGDLDSGGVTGALKGAGKGAGAGLEKCLSSAVAAAQLAPVVLVVCSVLVVPTATINGTLSGSQPTQPAEVLAAMQRRVNDTLRSADLSLALVNLVDEVGQTNARLAPYELAHGTLPPPDGEASLYAQAARWGYQTVMEIDVLEAGLEDGDGSVPLLQLRMAVKVTLVDTATGHARSVQEYEHTSAPQPARYWLEDNYDTLSRAIVQANTELTQKIVDDTFIK